MHVYMFLQLWFFKEYSYLLKHSKGGLDEHVNIEYLYFLLLYIGKLYWIWSQGCCPVWCFNRSHKETKIRTCRKCTSRKRHESESFEGTSYPLHNITTEDNRIITFLYRSFEGGWSCFISTGMLLK